jgi:hypothetical protein
MLIWRVSPYIWAEACEGRHMAATAKIARIKNLFFILFSLLKLSQRAAREMKVVWM